MALPSQHGVALPAIVQGVDLRVPCHALQWGIMDRSMSISMAFGRYDDAMMHSQRTFKVPNLGFTFHLCTQDLHSYRCCQQLIVVRASLTAHVLTH